MYDKKEVVILATLNAWLPIDGYGGIEKVTLQRTKYLKKLGYKVQIVGNIKDENLANSVISINKIIKYPSGLLPNIEWLLTLKWEKYISTFTKIKNEIWNAPILSDAGTYDPFHGYFLAKNLGIDRFLYYLHGNHYIINNRDRKIYQPLDKLGKFSMKINYGALNSRLNELLKSKGYKSYFMPNGIEFPDLSEINKNPENYCLFIGLISKRKAPHYAIKIAKNLNINLKIVGPIQDYYYFDTMIRPFLSEKIEYLGEVSNDILKNLLKRSKCLLFTSVWDDPQPAVVLEAVSYGVPVLALNYGFYSGIYDMIEDYKNGFIGNFEDLIKHASNIFELDRISIYEHSKNKWEWEKILINYHIPVIEKLGKDL